MQHAVRQGSLLDAFTAVRAAHDRRALGESTLAISKHRTHASVRRRLAPAAAGDIERALARAVAAELRRGR